MSDIDRIIGTPLDTDQLILKHCGWPECTEDSKRMPLILVVWHSQVSALCEYHYQFFCRLMERI